MRRWIILAVTHLGMLAVGFAAGVYTLPILIAPDGPTEAALSQVEATAVYTAEFDRDLEGSDALHWGEGEVMVSATQIAHRGALAPGPDYQVYLTPAFVETEEAFLALEGESVRIGRVASFDGFILDLPAGVDPSAYQAVVVWCESFDEFITAAQYR